MNNLTEQLAQLLRDTRHAHHQAFIAVDGADVEWPLWYADYLLTQITDLCGFNFSKSELVYALVAASKEQAIKAPGADWAAYYAQYFLEHYPKT